MRSVPLSRLALILALAACEKPAPPAFERPPAPVTAVAAALGDAPIYLDEIGRCVAREVVSIQPQVSGRITKIHFADGADVKADEPLFTIDPRPYQAQLDAAQASVAQAKASLELSKLDFLRAGGLLEKKAMSQQEFDALKSAVAVNEARMAQAMAALDTARINLDYCSIRSPIEGRTGRRLVDVGNIVAANSGSLLVIQRLQPIYADFSITEADLPRLLVNMARGALKVEVRIPDDPSTPRVGDVTFVDNTVQDPTGTVLLRATMANEDRRLWPGQFVRVRLILATLKGALLVPVTATQLSATGPFVYVIGEGSTAEFRPVVLGQRQGDRVIVEKGLKAGERVITSITMAIAPGRKVRIEETPAPGTTGK